jgi:NO-binding membrane sensor protein with MHYT domain
MHDHHAIQCIHDPMLVALSYLVAVLGSYTGLQLAIGIPAAHSSRERTQAVIASGAAIGVAIWAMHFIAMLACQMDVQVTYDVPLTAFSAVIGMVSCMAGLAIAGSGVFSWPKLGMAGVFMGLGVGGMHYTGMAAMRMAATTQYDTGIVALSLLIAIVASCAALWLAFNMRGAAQMLGSALVMGVAVCGMHYVGMAAATFLPTREAAAAATAGGIGGQYLGATIFGVTTVLLATVLAISLVRQQRRALVRI